MHCDRDVFYKSIRTSLFPALSQAQVDGLNHLLDTWDAHYATYPFPFLAYCLATAFHETARTMRPIEEWGHGHGHPYGPSGYYGRGYVQLTWEANYRHASERLAKLGINVDLVADKAKALDPVIAAHIMFLGMIEGWFTGRKLANYLPHDPIDARRIINGLDKANEIASYYEHFLAALHAPTVSA